MDMCMPCHTARYMSCVVKMYLAVGIQSGTGHAEHDMPYNVVIAIQRGNTEQDMPCGTCHAVHAMRVSKMYVVVGMILTSEVLLATR